MMQKNKKSADGKDSKKVGSGSLISSLVISLSIVLILLIALELVARTSWIGTLLPLRSVGNSHTQFEIKWFKLQDYVQEYDGVDVILMGNSMLNTGVDADIFVEEYEKATGTHLRVFNFGVEGLTVSPNSKIARLLVETYHPKTIIYFTEIRDYIAKNGVAEENLFLKDNWLSYQFGENNPTGWLLDNSKALQYWLPFKGWSRPDFLDTYIGSTRRERITSASGYEYENSVRVDPNMRPNPLSPDEAPLFELYSNFSFDEQRLEDLNSILSLENEATKVLISEIPIDPAFYDYFGGTSVHQEYYSDIQEYVSEQDGIFIPAIDADLIPMTGRADDYVHMSIKGAQLYSSLLAQELSAYCLEQHICLESKLP